MKKLLICLTLLSLTACLNDSDKKSVPDDMQELDTLSIDEADSLRVNSEDIEFKKKQLIVIKQEELLKKEDHRSQLEGLVISKTFLKEEDFYTMDFHYPYLNEKLNPAYVNFNEYLEKYYIDIPGVSAQILEDKELYCDSVPTDACREKRIIDYKIYNLNEHLISVLFYKENHYGGAMHPSYTFDCLNFDLKRSVFMSYDDFFVEGSEEEFRAILNELLLKKIASGEMYYDCWEVSADDFFEYKDNFVINDDSVEFYFDDCVICPYYTGTYSISIPLESLLPVLRRYTHNPLIG